MQPPWHAAFMTLENISHGEIEAVNKYFSIFFPMPEPSSRVAKRSEISQGGRAKGPCSFLVEFGDGSGTKASDRDQDLPAGH